MTATLDLFSEFVAPQSIAHAQPVDFANDSFEYADKSYNASIALFEAIDALYQQGKAPYSLRELAWVARDAANDAAAAAAIVVDREERAKGIKKDA